eukprot:6972400-Alexandrium_andersonii.AAC.1
MFRIAGTLCARSGRGGVAAMGCGSGRPLAIASRRVACRAMLLRPRTSILSALAASQSSIARAQ